MRTRERGPPSASAEFPTFFFHTISILPAVFITFPRDFLRYVSISLPPCQQVIRTALTNNLQDMESQQQNLLSHEEYNKEGHHVLLILHSESNIAFSCCCHSPTQPQLKLGVTKYLVGPPTTPPLTTTQGNF